MQTADMSSPELAGFNGAEKLYELGKMYASGRNGDYDIVTAHKWFNLAAHGGCLAAKSDRERLAAEMTSAEIASAQRAAREWITRH